jgi:molybdate transport system substrate-binding protein
MSRSKNLIIIFVLMTLLLSCLLIYHKGSLENNNIKTLFIYCAAGVKPPMFEVAQIFEKKSGIKIQFQYGGSGTLLSSLEISQIGDMYLAADSSYIEIASNKGLIKKSIPLAMIHPVVAVTAGNPKKIKNIADLKNKNISISFANPSTASIGKQAKKLLVKSGDWTEIEKNIYKNGVFKPSVPEVANDLLLGAVDAGIVWDATVAQFDELIAIEIPEFHHAKMSVSIGELSFSKKNEETKLFINFLRSMAVQQIFLDNGYSAIKR